MWIGLQGLAAAQDAQWLTDYEKALSLAKKENRMVLMDFTGSDWCPGCILWERKILSTKEFKDYASKNLVLMEVDFPESKPQSDAVVKQNAALQDKYGVEGYPTFILLDSKGKQLSELTGFPDVSPSGFIASLAKFNKS